MKIILMTFLFHLPPSCFSQVAVIQHGLAKLQIRSSIKQPGNVVEALSWSDTQGNNLLLLSESVTFSKNDTSNRNASLFVGQYLEVQGNWIRQWKVEDFENDCPVDAGAKIIPKSIEITDLDNNGIAEVSFMYRIFCAGGVDPQVLKFIMYERKNKFAIRGETLIKLPNQPAYGGETTVDKSFKLAPQEFQQFAMRQWNKYRVFP